MSKANNSITDYIRKNTAERFRAYEKEDDGYCFSISLTFANASYPEIKIALQETGAATFESKFNEAVSQGKKLGADRIIIREFTDPELPSIVERADLRQEIPLNLAKEKPATPRKKQQPEGLGMAQVNELVQAGMSTQQKELEIIRLKSEHERAIEKKDREIEKIQEILLKKQEELDETITSLKEQDKRVEELEDQLEEAKESAWSINKMPVGKLVADMALEFLQKKPQILSGILPAETVKSIFGSGDEAQEAAPGGQSAAGEPDQRQQYYDFVLQYMTTLNDDDFGHFLQLISAINQDASKLQLLASMANEQTSKSQ